MDAAKGSLTNGDLSSFILQGAGQIKRSNFRLFIFGWTLTC